MKKLTIYFDGGNAKGIATWAVLVKEDNNVVAKLTGLVDSSFPQTNNVAEWTALYMAIIYCYSKYPSDVYTFNILGDSELVIKQITGEYAVSNPHLKSIYQKANSIASLLRNLTFKWIPREENTEADALGRELR